MGFNSVLCENIKLNFVFENAKTKKCKVFIIKFLIKHLEVLGKDKVLQKNTPQ